MQQKKIVMFVSSIILCKRLIKEAIGKGHYVTSVIPYASNWKSLHANLRVVKGSIGNIEDVRKYTKGNEVVIYVNDFMQNKQLDHIVTTHSLIEGIRNTGVKHLIVSGHSLLKPLVLTAKEYESWIPLQHQQLEALNMIALEPGLRWSYFYTPGPEPGEQQNRFIFGKDFVIASNQGVIRMPVEEFCSALIDEIENTGFVWPDKLKGTLRIYP